MRRTFSFFLILCLALQGCATSSRKGQNSSSAPSRAGVSTLPSSSSSEEIAIGEKIHQQIVSTFYVYTDPKVVDYVTKVGKSLAQFAGRHDLPYRFTILYNEKIYATSSPGGFVYLTTGLLNFIDNEAELAAVMAHEIGQVQYSDPRLSRSRQILDQITRAGSMVGGAFGEIGMLAILGLAMVNAAAESRNLTPEQRLTQADQKALRYMVAAEEDPQGMIDMLYKFLNAENQVTPYFYDYYQSRPITEERVRAIYQEFSRLPLQGRSFSTNRRIYQDLTQGIREIYRR